MKKICCSLVLSVGLFLPSIVHALTIGGIEFSDVGNKGNPNDGAWGEGGISYDFRISTYEIQNSQYTAFLTAVGASDPNGLWNAQMASSVFRGGITRSGVSGSFTYAVKAGYGDKPVNNLSFYDTLRFVNWLQNGQPTGAQGPTTTENGTYDMSLGASVVRNTGSLFWLSSDSEWLKAAYYEPASGSHAFPGSTDYWNYPTRSDTAPTVGTSDSSGNINNGPNNVANYNSGAVWDSLTGNVTTVGSAGAGSRSYYGAYDMAGNVYEWTESLGSVNPSKRLLRGGGWASSSSPLSIGSRTEDNPLTEAGTYGFRIAMIPEPATVTLMGIASLLIVARRMGHARESSHQYRIAGHSFD